MANEEHLAILRRGGEAWPPLAERSQGCGAPSGQVTQPPHGAGPAGRRKLLATTWPLSSAMAALATSPRLADPLANARYGKPGAEGWFGADRDRAAGSGLREAAGRQLGPWAGLA